MKVRVTELNGSSVEVEGSDTVLLTALGNGTLKIEQVLKGTIPSIRRYGAKQWVSIPDGENE